MLRGISFFNKQPNLKEKTMSDPNSFPPPVPPSLLGPSSQIPALPLGEGADERLPVSGFIPAVESILRQPRRIFYQLRQGGQAGLIARLLVIAVLCGLVYGGV